MSETQRHKPARHRLVRAFWLSVAGICLVLGIIGIVVPGLPTTPFILLAAFAAGRGSERLHAWMRNHARFGPMLRDWEREGAVSRRAKCVATATMLASSVVLFLISPRWWMAAIACATMFIVAIWLWLRPEPGPRPE
ncbi:MAG TPA: YbaN family protein [Tahibacter sp.]|uniref:YbaN family protein n=1 Tax=Tahibacter sp. TaxID=2056211 RepID=UPI002BE25E7F|nr:YbaN family protein [Tahibacter sp.]HSX61782.1 YbaN family protein [Tahibacter sp.]